MLFAPNATMCTRAVPRSVKRSANDPAPFTFTRPAWQRAFVCSATPIAAADDARPPIVVPLPPTRNGVADRFGASVADS